MDPHVQAVANDAGTIKVAAEEAPTMLGSMSQQNAIPAAASRQDEGHALPLPLSVQALRPDIGGTVASDPRHTRPVKPRVALKERMVAQGQRPAPEGNLAAPQASAFKAAASNRKQTSCLVLCFFIL